MPRGGNDRERIAASVSLMSRAAAERMAAEYGSRGTAYHAERAAMIRAANARRSDVSTQYVVQVAGVADPVRFECADGAAMIKAGADARECAADLAEELGAHVDVWLFDGTTCAVVDTRLAGNPTPLNPRGGRRAG